MGTGDRWHERQASDRSVLISARPHGLRQARIRDVSSSGLFVELPPSKPLADNTQVELIFVRSTNQVSRLLRIPALVVRTTPSGAGLMFLDTSLVAFRTLLTQLLAEEKPAAQPSRATPEQIRLDTLQRLVSTMARHTHNTDTGISALHNDGASLKPRLPESGTD